MRWEKNVGIFFLISLMVGVSQAQSQTGGIQEQINALPQPAGGVVTVSSNVAMTTFINLNNKQNVTLRCLNNASISVPAGSNLQVINAGNFNNIVISGCTIIGPGANYPSSFPPALLFYGGSNVTLDHNTIQGGAMDGVYIQKTTTASVHDNVATLNGANGIECDATYCLIYSNTATHNGFEGVEVYAPGNHSDVSNNTAQFNGANGINLQSDPTAGSVSHVVVTNNTSTDNLQDGIEVGGIPTFPIDHVIVSGNTVLRNTVVGINLSSATEAIVSENTVEDNSYNHYDWGGGINCTAVTNSVIRQNTVANISSAGQQQYGVRLNDSGSTGNLIIQNTLDGNIAGPFFAVAGGTTESIPTSSNLLINNQ
jgi:parallel beta-helix repeat protein